MGGWRAKRDSVVTSVALSKKKAVKLRLAPHFSGRDAGAAVLSSRAVNRRVFAMQIDHATVRHIARLARLAVDDAAAPALAGELARVLELADHLAGVELAGIEPMAHPHAQTLVRRADPVS